MKKRTGLLILMGLSLAAITAFQVMWLSENYRREKRTLWFTLTTSFAESVRDLQMKKLNLKFPGMPDSVHKPMVRVFVNNTDSAAENGKLSVISTVNVIRDKITDSLEGHLQKRLDSIRHHMSQGEVVITMKKSELPEEGFPPPPSQGDLPPGADRIYNIIYGIDSLQDSLRVADIHQAFEKKLRDYHINIPFSITRSDTATHKPAPNEYRVGLAHPLLFRFDVKGEGAYIFHRLLYPLLFSVLLIGLTLAAFILLYRNLRKQQKLAEQKNEFISNITHELKTPVATVGVALEALRSFNAANDAQKTKEYLDISSQEIHRLGLLVDKVLRLSLFENKDVELRKEVVQMDALVEEVVDSLRLQAEKFGAAVSVEKKGDLQLQGDRLHLLSVIFNLVDNALKYRSADPKIKISLTGTGNNIEIKVSDNGIGIPPEYYTRVFEKFFRVPHGDTYNAQGYGLGLSYAARVVRLHGGTITAGPGEDGGSCFTIQLPKA